MTAGDPIAEFGRRLPEVPDVTADNKEMVAARYNALLDRYVAEIARDEEAIKRELENEAALFKALHETLREIAKSRAGQRSSLGELVQKASAAIVTLYTGVLALAFTAADNPLPLRGIYAAVFLGAAVALSTGYVAFLTQPSRTKVRQPAGGSSRARVLAQTQTLVDWVSTGVMDRAVFLRSSVLALALGLAFLPAAFVTWDAPSGSDSEQASRQSPTPTATSSPATASASPLVTVAATASPTASAAILPTWPPPDTATEQALLFQAQLAEISRLRLEGQEEEKESETANTARDDRQAEWVFGWSFVLALLGLIGFFAIDSGYVAKLRGRLFPDNSAAGQSQNRTQTSTSKDQTIK